MIPTVTGGAAYFTAEAFRREFFEEAKRYASEVAENVFHHVDRKFLTALRATGGFVDVLNDREQLAALTEIVELSTYRHRVEKLYFFEPDGTISFSTVRDHIGEVMPPGNPHFVEALSGAIASVVRRRRSPLEAHDISSLELGSELLETYVPVYAEEPPHERRLVGVVEVYQRMDELNRGVREVRIRIAFVALASMCVLGGVLAILTLKADRIIVQRELEILASNTALQTLSSDLERQVEERTRQLIQKEKLASLGTLAAGVAHEINTPLATISACAEGSIARLPEAGGTLEVSQIKTYLGLISEEVYRCKRITRNLLDFSRQHSSTDAEPLDINRLAEQTAELVRMGSEARGVQLDLDLHANSIGLVGDPSQIRQVIHNLLQNALAAVKGQPAPHVLLWTHNEAGRLHLECVDNGAGIPENDREKIFEPFYTTKPAGEGTGLGLTVSYSIAQRHGGTLDVRNPGRPVGSRAWEGSVGARFCLSLPRREQRGLTDGEGNAID